MIKKYTSPCVPEFQVSLFDSSHQEENMNESERIDDPHFF